MNRKVEEGKETSGSVQKDTKEGKDTIYQTRVLNYNNVCTVPHVNTCSVILNKNTIRIYKRGLNLIVNSNISKGLIQRSIYMFPFVKNHGTGDSYTSH